MFFFVFRNLLWGSINYGQSLHGLHNTKSLRMPGLAKWVKTLLHWCDSNAVFIVDVSRVYANSLPQDGKKQNQSVRSLHF